MMEIINNTPLEGQSKEFQEHFYETISQHIGFSVPPTTTDVHNRPKTWNYTDDTVSCTVEYVYTTEDAGNWGVNYINILEL